MNTIEIVLLVSGAVIFIISFFIPATSKSDLEKTRELIDKEIKGLVAQEMEQIKEHVVGVAEEAVVYSMEKTERSLERLSNEKIMAVNEYSDTVLGEINRNHKEVMFLYDMLNDKHKAIKNTAAEVAKTVKEAEGTAKGSETMNFQALKTEVVNPEREKAATSPKIIEAAMVVEHPEANPREVFLGREAYPGSEAYPGREVYQGSETYQGREAYSGSETYQGREAYSGSETYQGINAFQGTQAFQVRERVREKEGAQRNYNERILGLYNQGKSKVTIAKELGLGVGEVKLVIDLFKDA